MPKSVITSITFSSAPARRKPQAGDLKTLKRDGKTYIRQQQRCYHGPGRGAMVVSNGRPVWEWVEQGSSQDRVAVYAKQLACPHETWLGHSGTGRIFCAACNKERTDAEA